MIEQLWGLMHRHVTPEKCSATRGLVADVALDFLRGKVPENWNRFCHSVIENFRGNSAKGLRVMT
ncbi:MAG TPA: hypothetical protein VHT02_07870 [Methylocella sp.]|jgi:hypothetical protein|nr:hypothetical protein [Methylocella sp.]